MFLHWYVGIIAVLAVLFRVTTFEEGGRGYGAANRDAASRSAAGRVSASRIAASRGAANRDAASRVAASHGMPIVLLLVVMLLIEVLLLKHKTNYNWLERSFQNVYLFRPFFIFIFFAEM